MSLFGFKLTKKNKNKLLLISLIISILLLSANVFVLIFKVSDFINLTSFAPVTTGVVMFAIEGQAFINITSPLNKTYNFNVGDFYTLDLNVTSNTALTNWRYSLYDMRHGGIPVVPYENFAFFPNITLNAVRWNNRLVVEADTLDDLSETLSASVSFFINVSNSPPILGPINDSIFVCEGDFLEIGDYPFNASDPDEDHLLVGISPQDTFFVNPENFYDLINVNSNIVSGLLDKNDIGSFPRTIFVYDHYPGHIDTKLIDINVLEINNIPTIEDITAETLEIWTIGDNSTFYHETQVYDTEDGNSTDGNLVFSIFIFDANRTQVNLFNISSTGVMNFSVNSSTSLAVYEIDVCVSDTGILNPHENLSIVCGQDGSSVRVCNNFTLTITDKNRAPTITDYYPSNLSLNVSGSDDLYFNITKYDPDATVPDTFWYVDNSFMEYDNGLNSRNNTDEFTYKFPCGVGGIHILKAEITDGLLNDSVNWLLEVAPHPCPISSKSGGGGGGGTLITCIPEWGCDDWRVCQGVEPSLELGILSGGDFRWITEDCEINFLTIDLCGFQIRSCDDLKNCSTTYNKPNETQYCYYVDDPTCEDHIKNCHHGSCELLIDCGGPCPACATCSDNIRNQGEQGVDCGGPCPWKCPEKIPFLKNKIVLYIIGSVLLILIILLIIYIIRVLKQKKSIGESLKSE